MATVGLPEEWPDGTVAWVTSTRPNGTKVRWLAVRDDAGCEATGRNRWQEWGIPVWWTWEQLWAEGPVERLYRADECHPVETIGGHRLVLDVPAGQALCTVHGERYQIPTELERLRQREGGPSGS